MESDGSISMSAAPYAPLSSDSSDDDFRAEQCGPIYDDAEWLVWRRTVVHSNDSWPVFRQTSGFNVVLVLIIVLISVLTAIGVIPFVFGIVIISAKVLFLIALCCTTSYAQTASIAARARLATITPQDYRAELAANRIHVIMRNAPRTSANLALVRAR